MAPEASGMDSTICCNCEITLCASCDVFVRCDDCRKLGTEVVLCIQCFQMGAICGPHKRNHSLVVVDGKGAPMFKSKFEKTWGWKEDLNLIKAAHKHRLGDWPRISDMESDSTDCQPRLSGIGKPTAVSQWQCIVDYINNWKGTVDFSDPNWFQQFEADLMEIKKTPDSPPVLSPVKSETNRSSDQNSNSTIIPPPTSPISVEFQKGDDKRTRLLSSSDFEESEDEKCTSTNTSGSYANTSGATFNRASRHEDNKKRHSFGMRNNDLFAQSSDDEESEIDDIDKRKPILRLKRVGRRWRSKAEIRKQSSKKFLNEPLHAKISDEDHERLRHLHPEQFFDSVTLPPMGAEERSKLKDDDLQLLAYMPEREDFEWEFANDMEKLVSRLTIKSSNDHDDDALFENAVKLAKLQKYNRILKQRRARKAIIREYELVNKFFDKIKKKDGVAQNQKHIHSLMTKTTQVARRSELQGLSDALIEYNNLHERIAKLKSLQAKGIKELKGQKELIPERIKSKKKRRTPRYSDMQRRANLRWMRYKRWRMNQTIESPSIESDA